MASLNLDLGLLRLRRRDRLGSARERMNRMNTQVQRDVQMPPSLSSPSMAPKSCRDCLQISLLKTSNIPLITHPYLVTIPIRMDGAHLISSRLRFPLNCSSSPLHSQMHIPPHRSHLHPCLHHLEYRLALLSLPPRLLGRLTHHSRACYPLRTSSFPSPLFSFSSRITHSISNLSMPPFQLFDTC